MARIFDAQRGLKAALNNQASIDGVTIGYPAGGPSGPVTVWISGNVLNYAQEFTVSGLGSHDESFDLEIRIAAAWSTDDLEDAIALVEPILDAIEDALDADRSLAGAVDLAEIVAIEIGEGVDDDNRQRQLGTTVTVRCRPWGVT